MTPVCSSTGGRDGNPGPSRKVESDPPAGRPPVTDYRWRQVVQRRDGGAQLTGQPVLVCGGQLVLHGIQRDAGQAAHQHIPSRY